MGEPTVIAPGQGEVVGDSPDRRVEILSDRDELHATWSRFGPGRDGAGPHIHHRHTDLFYVLDGELTVRVGIEDEEVAVSAGTVVRVPPLVMHGFRNASNAEVRYLNLHAPGEGFADFMRGLRDATGVDFDQGDPPADGGLPATEAKIGGEQVVLDGPGRRETLLADVDTIRITETWAEPGGPAPPSRSTGVVSLYVLEGEIALTLGDREAQATAGTWVQAPPGVSYSYSIPSPGPARFLTIHTPGRGVSA